MAIFNFNGAKVNKAIVHQINQQGGKTVGLSGKDGGLIPKIEYGLKALENGVAKVLIINGTKRHAILLELFTDSGIGTEVTA